MTSRTSEEERLTNARVVAADRKSVFHSWSAQATNNPIPVLRSEGSRFYDHDGKEYLDFSSQLVFTNLGHQHPRVVAAVQKQVGELACVAPQHACHVRTRAAEKILSISGNAGKQHDKVFFTNGGADANENAIRMARLHTKKHKVLSFYRSYHGSTGAAVNATGDPRRLPNEHCTGHVHFWGPYLYRTSFWAKTPEEECERALWHLEQTIIFEGPGHVAALMIETIPGTAGIMVPPPGYLEGVRALCDKYNIMWIADEVMCGFGRTGKWFAYQHSGVMPDLVTFAKGVTSGYVPLGGVIMTADIAKTFDETVFPGGLTYMGHPVATACALEVINTMEDENVVEHCEMLSKTVLEPGLTALMKKHKLIGEVRGIGCFWCIELVTDRSTRAGLAPYGGSSPAMNEFLGLLKAAGYMPFNNFNRLHLVPPCNISVEDCKLGIDMIDQALAKVAKYYTGSD